MTFNSLNIIDPILKAIAEEGYITPTPIQVKSIPLVLEGKDIIGCAQTGTGKTAAFAVPILQLLSRNTSHGTRKKFPKALIVTPTRELAIQIGEKFSCLWQAHTDKAYCYLWWSKSKLPGICIKSWCGYNYSNFRQDFSI